jgi:peptidoglycan hydrolase CwlO-like protein
MNEPRKKRTISLTLALFLMGLILLTGTVVVYVQYDQKQKYIAASEQAFAAKENYVSSVFDRIESNLAKIRERESMINQNLAAPENTGNLQPEERIQNEINYIQALIDENNQLIASLNKQIDEKDSRLKNYAASEKDLKSKIAGYQEQVNTLVADKEALQNGLAETIKVRDRLEAKVDTMGNDIAQKSSEIEKQNKLLEEKENAMHTAYYTIGSYKSLRDKNVVVKEGGFLGLNRVTMLATNPDPNQFKYIDTREVTRIPVNAEHWEIVTGQDPSSYKLEFENGLGEWIHITNPDKFWGKSKYLVIVVRESESADMTASR